MSSTRFSLDHLDLNEHHNEHEYGHENNHVVNYDSEYDVEHDDNDTASQRSIPLSSPPASPRHTAHTNSILTSGFSSALADTNSAHEDKNDEHAYGQDSDDGHSEHDEHGHRLHGDEEYEHDVRAAFSHRDSLYTLDASSGTDDGSLYTTDLVSKRASSVTSATPSERIEDHGDGDKSVDEPAEQKPASLSPVLPTYPPTSLQAETEAASITSLASGSSRKARPESLLLEPPKGPLVLGVALVDFNHLVGPRIEFSQGEIFEDEEVAKILPFLALPDGAHLSSEDYSYFHLVPSTPNPSTIFGISCNRQIATSELLVKDADATRSIVQKAVVILASKPVFGPIRDKLGVVTRALFNQRDFRETGILVDFAASLEISLRSQLTESGLYMGTSLRELVHMFRQKTLVLLKALMLQKKILFYGHPVERLCTYQYSLVSLMPGLLQTLEDCGSPPLASRAPTLSPPSSLRTSDHRSMMTYMGLPLDIFGKDAFFQPYLPLQQLDVVKETKSWLCGSTNSIVTQQKEIDLLVNTETGTFEFRDPRLERSAGLTAADRKWMDDIVRDVNDGWDIDDPTRPTGMQFKGSDDYLRTKFGEYVNAALASVKYRDFLAKGEGAGVIITGGTGGDANSVEDFNPLWMAEFKRTNAYEVWNRITDPLLFDIVEPRHPCNEKPSVVADIGLRLQEGIQDLKLDQQLAPTREAITRTISAGQSGFFRAVEGVRGRWAAGRTASTGSDLASSSTSTLSGTPVEVSKADAEPVSATLSRQTSVDSSGTGSTGGASASRPSSVGVAEVKPSLGGWGIGSFLRTTRFSIPRPGTTGTTPVSTPVKTTAPPLPEPIAEPSVPPISSASSARLNAHKEGGRASEEDDELHPKDLDNVYGEPAGMAL